MDWQPIETAPKDGTRVLLIGHRGAEADIGNWSMHGRYDRSTKRYGICWGCAGIAYVNPTHWMPLPPPPVQP